MKFPRSLRELRDVQSRFTRPRDVNRTPAPVDYGPTHTFPGQGSMPAIPPTPTFTVFAPDGPQVPNTQGVAQHPWPGNTGRPVGNPSGGRSSAIATDWQLQTGPAPTRIQRDLFDRMRDMVGPTGGNDVGMASFPYNAEWSWLPHVPIVRHVYAVKDFKSFDDNAVIPAVYAGNPRQ